jgi:hypothetical protein
MYLTIRKYAGKGGLIGRLAPPVRDGLVPLLRQAPGSKGYGAFASEDGHVVSVSVFDDREAAVRANEQVREWVGANLRDMLPDPPEVLAGEALLHEEAQLQSGGQGMFATVRSEARAARRRGGGEDRQECRRAGARREQVERARRQRARRDQVREAGRAA